MEGRCEAFLINSLNISEAGRGHVIECNKYSMLGRFTSHFTLRAHVTCEHDVALLSGLDSRKLSQAVKSEYVATTRRDDLEDFQLA